MYTIPVTVDESGCAVASAPIPEDAVMTVLTATEVTVYEAGDTLPVSVE